MAGPPLLAALDLPVEGTLIVDFYGDLHVGSPHFAREKFEADLAETLADPARIAVFNGDLFNLDTKAQKHGGLYEATMDLDGCIDYLEARLAPLGAKVALATEGNHDQRAYDQIGLSPVKQLMARLRLADRYAPHGGWLWTKHGKCRNSHRHEGGARPIQYTGYFNHGTGLGPSSTSAERIVRSVRADYYGLSHTHTNLSSGEIVYEPHLPTGTVIAHEKKLAVSPAYLEYGGYALDRRYVPRPLGKAEFHLSDGDRKVRVVLP